MRNFLANRNTALVAILFFFCSLGAGYGQNRKLVLNFEQRALSADIKEIPLKDVLVKFEQRKNIWFDTGFINDSSVLDDNISIELENVTIKEGLERILTGINHSFIFKGNKIVGVMLFGKPEKRVYRGRTSYQRDRITRPATTRRRP